MLGAQPAEIQQLPGRQVGRVVADTFGPTVADVGPGGHERPEGRRVLGAPGVARRVVHVGQAEVMGVLVGEDPEAAVLRLDGVVTEPHSGGVVRDQAAADQATVGADLDTGHPAGAADLKVGVPAVAPDGVGALVWVTGRLVAAGVDDLHVVDVAVRLVEDAVTVEVVAVPDVELLQVGLDVRHRLARVELLLDPDRHGVAGQRLGGGADDAPAVVAAVERLVEGHLDPALDLSGHRVPVGGLGLEVLRHPIEIHVLVVGLAVVGLPQRGIVDGAVRRGNLVVERAGHIRRAAVGRRSLEDGVGVLLVAELDDDDEDRVGGLTLEFDVLPLAHLDGLGRVLGPILEALLDDCLLLRGLLVRDRQGVRRHVPISTLVIQRGKGARVGHGGCRCGRGHRCHREQGGGERARRCERQCSHP